MSIDFEKLGKTQQNHILSAFYFLCCLSPGFLDSLTAHPVWSTHKWRGLVTAVDASVPTLPLINTLESKFYDLGNCGNFIP